jgi:hypothetical protein
LKQSSDYCGFEVIEKKVAEIPRQHVDERARSDKFRTSPKLYHDDLFLKLAKL